MEATLPNLGTSAIFGNLFPVTARLPFLKSNTFKLTAITTI